MKQFILFVMTLASVACGGSVGSVGSTGTPDPGASGSAGAAGDTSGTGGTSASGGQAGSPSTGGSAGEPSTGGSAGVDTDAGAAGSDDDAGMAGASGSAGSSGAGGASGSDAGPDSDIGDAGQTEASDSGPCETTVKVTTSDFNTGDVPIGSKDNAAFTLTLEATTCADAIVHGVDLMAYSYDADFIPGDVSWFCAGDCKDPGDFAFSDARYQAGPVLMGPTMFQRYDATDPKFGSAVKAILQDEFLLKAGTSVTGKVLFDVTGPAVTPIVGKRVFIGLVAFGAHRVGGNSYGEADQAKIEWNMAQEEPFTVVDAPQQDVLIELAPSSPSSRIVLGGTGRWEVFSTSAVVNSTDQDVLFPIAYAKQVDPNGDNADFTQVALAINGALVMQSSAVDGNGKWVLIGGPDNSTVTVPAHSALAADVWGMMANVVSSASVNGAWHGAARSGHTPALALDSILLTVPGSNQVVTALPQIPSSMVLRKSKPTFAKTASTSLITGSQQPVYVWTAQSDAAGPVALAQVQFDIVQSAGVQLCNFKILKNAAEVMGSHVTNNSDWGGYQVLGGYGVNPTECLTQSGRVAVWFENEEVLSGSGDLYSLTATVNGVVPGSTVSTKPVQTDSFFTDDLGCGGPPLQGAYHHPIPGVIWSDLSELPHAYNIPDCPGTKDWIGDALLEDLTLSHTLVQ